MEKYDAGYPAGEFSTIWRSVSQEPLVKTASRPRIGFLELDITLQNLLRFLVFAGGSVPERLVTKVSLNTFWGTDGEVRVKHGVAAAFIPDAPTTLSNLEYLEQEGYITSTLEQQRIYLAAPATGTSVIENTTDVLYWKWLVATAIFEAFPKDREIEPVYYSSTGQSLIRNANLALSYFLENENHFDKTLVVEACMAISYFGSASWKRLTISLAESACDGVCDPALHAMVMLRKTRLARIYRGGNVISGPLWTLDQIRTSLSSRDPVEPRSNAHLGELVLFRAQLVVDRGGKTQDVQNILKEFHALGRPSTLEHSILHECQFILARSLRFQGRFDEAASCLQELFQRTAKRSVPKSAALHFSDVECEREHSMQAIRFLESESVVAGTISGSKHWRQLQFSRANANLMCGLWNWVRKRERNSRWFEDAKNLFPDAQKGIEESAFHRHMVFGVHAGLGMIYLVQNDMEAAFSSWTEALDIAKECWPEPGHSEMITLYALSQVYYRIGRDGAHELAASARAIFRNKGRQYYFVGQGTLWLDVLSDLAEDDGQQRLVSRVELSMSS
ncbi:Uu.00g024400.m01.CDS01 [Anthostomella pinea]|uniref:Uu.00g024400.m01.CDS01 n=1 Tax=Anthostomella pinea TaxID=933095 RepID=A0AAI8VUC9_9PEZI|nr:Uu.00g024400.m01.CDS01 [Anthostomella pinea]